MQASCEFSKLTIPNDRQYVKIAVNYVAEIAKKFGFDDKDTADVCAALTEAAKDIIEDAFGPHERTSFDISCERVPLGLKVVIRDMGLPFDPKQSSKRGLGKFAARSLVDEFSFNNLGEMGKETILVKYLRNRDITDYFEACNLEPYAPPSAAGPSVPEAVEFIVRHMLPDEAIEVSRAVYRAYGYTYALPHVYYPERIMELNASGHMYSAVAVTRDGDFAGHCALFKWHSDDPVADLGLGVVKPEYRSRGVFNLLTGHLIAKARSENLAGISGQAVTNHTYSQRVGHRCGLRDCAIALAVLPETEIFMGITEKLTQRISVVAHFLYLSKPQREVIFPPSHHKAIIKKLYENLGFEPEMAALEESPILEGQSAITTETGFPPGCARIEVKQFGENVVSEVKSRLKDLCLKRFDVIQLLLNLRDPQTSAYVEHFERLGFFFAGIRPGGRRGDDLILQYLNNVPLDYDNIKIESQLGRDLLEYIKALDPNRNI